MDDLSEYRAQIDKINIEILEALAKRFEITDKIGRLKVKEQIPFIDLGREQTQLDVIREFAKEKNINPGFAARLFQVIMTEVVRRFSNFAKDAGDVIP